MMLKARASGRCSWPAGQRKKGQSDFFIRAGVLRTIDKLRAFERR